MIIYINGPYGVGKTSIARNLIKKIPSSILFDPEEIGFLLNNLIPSKIRKESENRGLQFRGPDWTELNLWKKSVVDIGIFLRKEYNQNVIIPQTILNKSTLSYILEGFKKEGEKVYSFCLIAEKEILEERLIKRIKEMRMEHLIGTPEFYPFEKIDQCLEVFSNEKNIDTSGKSVDEISDILLSRIN